MDSVCVLLMKIGWVEAGEEDASSAFIAVAESSVRNSMSSQCLVHWSRISAQFLEPCFRYNEGTKATPTVSAIARLVLLAL